MKRDYFKMQQRSLNMWDTVVKEVEDVGMGVASAVKDEIISIEKEVEKIESVAGKFLAIYYYYMAILYEPNGPLSNLIPTYTNRDG